MIRWFLVHSQSWATITTIDFITFFVTPKETEYPLATAPEPHLPKLLATTSLLSALQMGLLWACPDKWIRPTCGLWHLTFFTQHSVSKAHPCGNGCVSASLLSW